MSHKEIYEERREKDEIEYLNRLVAERMERIQKGQIEREAKLERIRIQQENRLNALVRMVAVILLYAAMAVAMFALAYTKVVAGWLCLSVAVGLGLCGAFRAGFFWREAKI